jgi:hypothetical protein
MIVEESSSDLDEIVIVPIEEKSKGFRSKIISINTSNDVFSSA